MLLHAGVLFWRRPANDLPFLHQSLPLWLGCCLLLSCQTATSVEEETAARLPNIVIILTDDQGYADVGCYGAVDIATPYLDRLAAQGARLTSFYAAQAVCTASRVGLLTGCYPNRIGMHQALMPNSPVGLHPAETILAELLKTKGYATAVYGKWHLGDHPDFMPWQQGFDDYFGIPYSNDMWPLHPQQGPIFDFGPLPLYEGRAIIDTLTDQTQLTTQITERSVDFIAANADQPFFLYVAHPQPHVPLYVSDRFRGQSDRGLYGDVIMELDWSVGQVVAALETHGLTDNTLVIFTSDNGPWLAYGDHAGSALPYREGKGTAWEGGHRAPFIARYPPAIPAGRVVDAPVMAIDILPTVAELVGTGLPERSIDGRSAWPLLTGQTEASPQPIYYFYYRVNELHAVRAGDWKLYFPHTYRSLNGRPGGSGGQPGTYEQLAVTEPELYQLSDDPGETRNVAAAHPDVVTRLQAWGDSARHSMGDRLRGMVGTHTREPGRRVVKNR